MAAVKCSTASGKLPAEKAALPLACRQWGCPESGGGSGGSGGGSAGGSGAVGGSQLRVNGPVPWSGKQVGEADQQKANRVGMSTFSSSALILPALSRSRALGTQLDRRMNAGVACRLPE